VNWTIEHTDIGRIVVPPCVPDGFALFCTTRDYPGKIIAHELTAVIRERFNLATSSPTSKQQLRMEGPR
jgi:hypothetical protein